MDIKFIKFNERTYINVNLIESISIDKENSVVLLKVEFNTRSYKFSYNLEDNSQREIFLNIMSKIGGDIDE